MRRSRVSKDRWGNLKRSNNIEPAARATTENYFGQPHKPGSAVRLRNTDKSDTGPLDLRELERHQKCDRTNREDEEKYSYL